MKYVPEVIIIDDDPIITNLIVSYLEDYDLAVDAYNDPNLALDMIVKHKPKIVFIDMNMPRMRGDQLIVKLSEKFIFQTTSLFLVTGEVLSEMDRMKFMTLGFEHIINKPFDEKDICRAIESVMGTLRLKQKILNAS